MNKSKLVRDSCAKVMQKAKDVKINMNQLDKFAQTLSDDIDKGYNYKKFNEYDFHFTQFNDPEQFINYIFVLDTLNFCFWPSNWEYENLSNSLKNLSIKNSDALKPCNLAQVSKEYVKKEIFQGIDFPLLDERVRLLNEVGTVTINKYQGQFINIIKASQNSAVKLLDILTSDFNNFQDHALYQGEQICFYKRSQIMVGDLYAGLHATELCNFADIGELTMFPDYRVPQLLNTLDILQYSNILQEKIKNQQVFDNGSSQEIEIRAATVNTVELLKEKLQKLGKKLISIELDWILWQRGEEQKNSILPHHRVLTIFY